MPKIEPTILSPSGVDLDKFDSDAVRATQRLVSRGYEAYLVGGCVRDHLLDRSPKDYDIATAARPQQVKRTFPRNCRIIGRRFKLAHLHFDRNTKILEVSTFRRTPEDDGGDDLLITRDNEFGNAAEDAMRRDFTVNALFLDPTNDAILDYCNGLRDIRARVIRTIGDPRVRFREDPVRILRAAKFAGRLGFTIEPETFAAMAETAGDLVRAAPPRVLEEILRLLRGGHALDSFQLLRDVGALKSLVPVVADFLAEARHEHRVDFWRLLEALDHRVQDGDVPQNAVLLGVLLVLPVMAKAELNPERSPSSIAEELLGSLGHDLKLPRRDAGCLKRICGVQHRFEMSAGGKRFRVEGFVRGPYFAEALELFELRVHAESADPDALANWQDIAIEHDVVDRRPRHRGSSASDDDDDQDRAGFIADDDLDDGAEVADQPARPKRRRRRRGRKPAAETAEDSDVYADDSGSTADDIEEPAATEVLEAAADNPSDDDDGLDPAAPGRRRRRRRRRRKSGAGETRPEEPGDEASAADESAPSDQDGDDFGAMDNPFERTTTDRAAAGDADSDADADVDADAALEAGTGETADGRPGRRKRRRRRQKKSASDSHDRAEEGVTERTAEARGPARKVKPQQAGKKPKPRPQRKGRRNDRPHDVDVVPRFRDRRGKVEVIEPPALDLSAFDVELDPRRVPTFGTIVEGKGRPKRRSPRVRDDGTDDYRPPPPPGSDDAPPPPPRSDDDPDTFGDW